MSRNIKEKTAAVAEISHDLAKAQTMVIAEYRGIKVSSLTQLRTEARKNNVYIHVLKNTLVKRAVKGTAFETLAAHMTGPLLYAASEDPVAAARLLHNFAKKEAVLTIKSGVFNGELLSVDQIVNFASIPSREELLAKLVGMMQAHIATFARALGALAEKNAGTDQPAAAAN